MQWRRLVAITGSYPRNDANEIGHEVARRELAFDVDLVKIPGQPTSLKRRDVEAVPPRGKRPRTGR
jgi:hypothetical protein